jgi:hypothetical protein
MTVYSASPIRFAGVSQVTASLGANDPEVGACIREGDEEYIFVYNTGSNAQINPGHAAVLSGVTGYSVTVSSVSMDLAIGVCKHATITTGAYGWLCKKGFVAVEMGANYSCVTGQLLELGVDGVFDVQSNTTGNAGYVAKAMESIASGASGQAYVKF